MNARDYIAWSLAFSGMFGALFVALAFLSNRYRWADRERASEGRRLQRKLDRRLARGSDRYHEELRSIQSRIELHERSKTIAAPRPIIDTILTICFVLLFGFYIMYWAGPSLFNAASPVWMDGVAFWWVPIAGAQRLVESFREDSQNRAADRAIGGLMLGTGCLIMLQFFFHLSAKA